MALVLVLLSIISTGLMFSCLDLRNTLVAKDIVSDCTYDPRNAMLLVLVIANKNPIYETYWAVWQRLKHDDPNIQVYFLLGDLNLTSAVTVNEKDNIVRIPTSETLIPGVLDKTVHAIQYFLQDSHRNFKYILRTNLSSMWHWQRLLQVLRMLNDTGVYAGVRGPGFVSGAGMLLSRDVAELLIENRSDLDMRVIDDVAIGALMTRLNIRSTILTRYDYTSTHLPAPLDKGERFYHYRIKTANRQVHDPYLFSRLYFELYPSPPSPCPRPLLGQRTTPT